MTYGSYWTRPRGSTLTRRRALGMAALGAGVAFAAACGGDDDDEAAGPEAQATTTGPAPAGGAATQAAETPVKGGTLRRGTWLNVLGIDPHIEVSIGLVQMAAVYTYL